MFFARLPQGSSLSFALLLNDHQDRVQELLDLVEGALRAADFPVPPPMVRLHAFREAERVVECQQEEIHELQDAVDLLRLRVVEQESTIDELCRARRPRVESEDKATQSERTGEEEDEELRQLAELFQRRLGRGLPPQ